VQCSFKSILYKYFFKLRYLFRNTNPFYNFLLFCLGEKKIELAVLIRRGAKIRGNQYRDRVIRSMRRERKKWKETVGCGKR